MSLGRLNSAADDLGSAIAGTVTTQLLNYQIFARFFSFDWFIFGTVFFTWLLVGVFIFSGRLYKYRCGLLPCALPASAAAAA